MNLPTSDNIFEDCAGVSDVLSRVGDKWVVQIVVVLSNGDKRFNSIKRTVPGISQQMLTRTLRALESDGMVKRTVYETSPPQTEYSLTPLGVSLSMHLRGLASWALEHRSTIRDSRERFAAKHGSD